jgi:branched-chain amino acid transport system ATP-binding protein
MARAALDIKDLHAWYGDSHVLHGMTFHVEEGEVVTLLGRNGAGKTTTMRALMGSGVRRQGEIIVGGVEAVDLPSHKIAHLGLAWCPEERGIFSSLSVQENLMLPPEVKPGGLSVEEIHDMFPRLKERAKSQGTKLSGGEQQMLAIARILRTGAHTLLLDEPTEGLAPIIVKQIGRIIAQLRERGFTIVLVEQNFHFASTLADRNYVVDRGRVIDMIPNHALAENKEKLIGYLGV